MTLTVGDIIHDIGHKGQVIELVATGGPADVTCMNGGAVNSVRVDGYTSVMVHPAVHWQVDVRGEPVQFGVRVKNLGLVWSKPEAP